MVILSFNIVRQHLSVCLWGGGPHIMIHFNIKIEILNFSFNRSYNSSWDSRFNFISNLSLALLRPISRTGPDPRKNFKISRGPPENTKSEIDRPW